MIPTLGPELCNLSPCLVQGPPSPPKQMGSLFNVRQDITRRAACKFNGSSMSSSYLSMSWLVPEGPNSMLGPSPQAIAQKPVPSTKECVLCSVRLWKPGETVDRTCVGLFGASGLEKKHNTLLNIHLCRDHVTSEHVLCLHIVYMGSAQDCGLNTRWTP